MSSLGEPNRQSSEHDAPPPLRHGTRQSSTSEASRGSVSSPSQQQNSTSGTKFHMPDTLSERGILILKQQREIVKLKTQISKQTDDSTKRKSDYTAWSKQLLDKMEKLKRDTKIGKDGYKLEAVEQKQRAEQLELQNTTLTKANADFEEELKQERGRLHAVGLERDDLQRKLNQQQILMKQVDEVSQRTREDLDDIVLNATNMLKNVEQSLSDESRYVLQQDWDFHSELRRETSLQQPRKSDAAGRKIREHSQDSQLVQKQYSQEQLQHSQGAAYPTIAGPYHASSTTHVSRLHNNDLSPNARKRGSEGTDGMHMKRIKVEHRNGDFSYRRGGNTAKGVWRGESHSRSRSLSQNQHATTLDPRPQAVARQHSTRTTIPDTILRSL